MAKQISPLIDDQGVPSASGSTSRYPGFVGGSIDPATGNLSYLSPSAAPQQAATPGQETPQQDLGGGLSTITEAPQIPKPNLGSAIVGTAFPWAGSVAGKAAGAALGGGASLGSALGTGAKAVGSEVGGLFGIGGGAAGTAGAGGGSAAALSAIKPAVGGVGPSFASGLGGAAGAGIGTFAVGLISGQSFGKSAAQGIGSAIGFGIGNAILPGIGGFIGSALGGFLGGLF